MASERRNTKTKSSAARTAHKPKPSSSHRRGSSQSDNQGWIWGRHAVLAALNNPKRDIVSVHVTGNAAKELNQDAINKVHIESPDQIAARLPDQAIHQGFAVQAKALTPESVNAVSDPTHGLLIVLDQITDPQNVGAIMRSAAAFGARAIIMQDRKSPPLFGALCKASVGCAEIVPHIRVTNIADTLIDLYKAGRTVIGMAGEAEHTLGALITHHAGPGLVLVMGAEGKGLRARVAEHCNYLARIPISPKAESLNVSVAAAIALYECSRYNPRIDTANSN